MTKSLQKAAVATTPLAAALAVATPASATSECRGAIIWNVSSRVSATGGVLCERDPARLGAVISIQSPSGKQATSELEYWPSDGTMGYFFSPSLPKETGEWTSCMTIWQGITLRKLVCDKYTVSCGS